MVDGRLFDGEGGIQAQDFGIWPAPCDKSSFKQFTVDNVCTVPELNGQHQAPAAHVADKRHLLLQSPEALQKVFALECGAPDQIAFLNDIDDLSGTVISYRG